MSPGGRDRSKIGSGEIEAVAPIIEEAVKVFEQKLGENNVYTLRAKLFRLLLLSNRGDAQAARQFASELIPRFEQIFGPTNPATLQARFAEGGALLGVGESQAAQSLLEPVVTELEKVLGQYHAEVLMAKVCLAQAQQSNRDFDNARRTDTRPQRFAPGARRRGRPPRTRV